MPFNPEDVLKAATKNMQDRIDKDPNTVMGTLGQTGGAKITLATASHRVNKVEYKDGALIG